MSERWNGEVVRFNAQQVSDGLLRLVAIAALFELSPPPSLILIDEIENAAIAYVAASTIDHLTPNGSAEIADKLDEIVEKNKKAADNDKMLRDKPIRDVSYRIRARAK